jgi:hypothetical protein
MKPFIAEVQRLQKLAGIIVEEKVFNLDQAFNNSKSETKGVNSILMFLKYNYPSFPQLEDFISKFKNKPLLTKKEYWDFIISQTTNSDDLINLKITWNLHTYNSDDYEHKKSKEVGEELFYQKNPQFRELNNKIDINKELNKLIKFLNKNKVNINSNLKYISPSSGNIKPQSDNIYDFGGSEGPIPNSVVVDIEKPDGNNKFIEQDLEDEFTLPPKQYINLSSVIHFITNKNNLVKSINNSLKPGGILVLKSSLTGIFEILPYLSNYVPLEAYIDKEETLSSDDDPDTISIAFKKS